MSGITESPARYASWRTRLLHVEGTGPTFVFLHGFGDSAETWRGVLRRLGQSGRSAVAVDLPGFAEADDLSPGRILPQLDRFVAAVVEAHRGPEGVVLVGNSLGALSALRAAGRGVPILGAVPIAEPACGDSWTIRQFRMKPTPIVVRLLELPVPVSRKVSIAVITAAARAALGKRAAIHDPGAARRLGEYFGGRRGGHVWAVRTSHALALETVNCYDFDRITVPVTIVHGARDKVIPTNAAEFVHAAIPHSSLIVRSSWGHCPQLQDPAGVTKLLLDFADSLDTENGRRSRRAPKRSLLVSTPKTIRARTSVRQSSGNAQRDQIRQELNP